MEQKSSSIETLAAGTRIYFIGIGGISMSGLAEISQSRGCVVAGSDRHTGGRTHRLETLGILVHSGHRAEWIDEFRPDVVVHTAAVHADNPEWIRACQLALPVVDRSDFLGWINRGYARVVNISGTHGKTTTTAMCASILIHSGQDPTVHLGAELAEFGSSVRLGQPGGTMVSEACEYMNSFLRFFSTTAAILNIDYDHVDCFRDIDHVIDTFAAFARLLPADGTMVIPAFDPNVAAMVERLSAGGASLEHPLPRIVSFGHPEDRLLGAAPVITCENVRYIDGHPAFDVRISGEPYVSIELHIPGEHNVMNALAAIACAWCNGGTPEGAQTALEAYIGAEGRFDVRGTYRGATVISDYAHHPAAARATLRAAQAFSYPHTWVVFQPLTYSRTRVLFDDFVQALLPCAYTVFAEIFSDRETDPGDMSSRMLADRINQLGGRADFARDFDEIKYLLDSVVEADDLILVLGPEEIRGFADWLIAKEPRT